MIFKYKGIDSKGKKVKDKIEALSISEAKSKLKVKGIIKMAKFFGGFKKLEMNEK
jgi:type II secretory pathway component PulF